MANSNGWGDGAANNSIGWGQGANNAIGWGDSHAKSWAGLTDIVGLTTDPDAQAFITAAAITDPTQQAAIDTLVKGLKTDGIWTKMKAIYPFVGGTATTHKWNLKDPRDLDAAFRLVFNGGWTHSSTGATPNGTNGYADTKLVPSSVLSLNSVALSFYSRTNSQGNIQLGANDATNYLLQQMFSSTQMYSQLNSLGASFIDATVTQWQGLFTTNRSTSSNVSAYKNGVNIKNDTKVSTARPTIPIYLGARNSEGLPANYDIKQNAFTAISDGLTDTEAANLYTRVQAYQTALSRQV
jgi:hypothetical protein